MKKNKMRKHNKSTGCAIFKKRSVSRKNRQRWKGIVVLLFLLFFCLLWDTFLIKELPQKVKNKESRRKIQEEGKATEKQSSQKGCDQRKIRVLISSTDFTSVFHSGITVTSQQNFTVVSQKEERSYQAGETAQFIADELKENKYKIECEEGKLQVSSINRQSGLPSYRGSLEILRRKKGLLLINEVTVKEYLYGVIPSEMEAESELEALKAQAVCARSFALRQMEEGRCDQYSADVDDSTNFQVYNNISEEKSVKRAVKQTKDQVVLHQDKLISTYYFSTSWGAVAGIEDVWGGEEIPYLKEKLQITRESSEKKGISDLDLSEEKLFKSFIQKAICDTYDSMSSWYRWNVVLSADELTMRTNVGQVKKLKVMKREKSGMVTKLQVTGSQGKEIISSAYQIRRLLYPGNKPLVCQDKTQVNDLTLLPSSAIFIQDSVSDGNVEFVIYGGGFGHGVGMSQSGAKRMAAEGWSYQEILEHYFSGCRVSSTK